MGGADVNLPKLIAYRAKLAELTQQVQGKRLQLQHGMERIRNIWDDSFFQSYMQRYSDLDISLGSFVRDSGRIQESLGRQIAELSKYLGRS